MDNIDQLCEIIEEEIQSLDRSIKHSYIKAIPAVSFIVLVLSKTLYLDITYFQKYYKDMIYWFTFSSNLYLIIFLLINQFFRRNSIRRIGVGKSSMLDRRKNFFGHVYEIFQFVVMLITNLMVSSQRFESALLSSFVFIVFAWFNLNGVKAKYQIVRQDYSQSTGRVYRGDTNNSSVESSETNSETATQNILLVGLMVLMALAMIVNMFIQGEYIVQKMAFEYGVLMSTLLIILNLLITSTAQVLHIKWLEQLKRMIRFEKISFEEARSLLEEHYNSFRTELLYVEEEHFKIIT